MTDSNADNCLSSQIIAVLMLGSEHCIRIILCLALPLNVII